MLNGKNLFFFLRLNQVYYEINLLKPSFFIAFQYCLPRSYLSDVLSGSGILRSYINNYIQ